MRDQSRTPSEYTRLPPPNRTWIPEAGLGREYVKERDMLSKMAVRQYSAATPHQPLVHIAAVDLCCEAASKVVITSSLMKVGTGRPYIPLNTVEMTVDIFCSVARMPRIGIHVIKFTNIKLRD
jgi:hypothetical protein